MKKFAPTLAILAFILPSISFAAALTPQQSNSLIAVVQSSPGTPASVFVPLITAFSNITVTQATSLITVIQATPNVPAIAFVNLLTSFTVDTPATKIATPATNQAVTPTTSQSTTPAAQSVATTESTNSVLPTAQESVPPPALIVPECVLFEGAVPTGSSTNLGRVYRISFSWRMNPGATGSLTGYGILPSYTSNIQPSPTVSVTHTSPFPVYTLTETMTDPGYQKTTICEPESICIQGQACA